MGLGWLQNQVALDARIFVMKRKASGPLLVINPEVEQAGRMTEVALEGCLSNPGMRYPVERPKKCIISYLDEHQQRKSLQLTGIDSRCALHEIDHLNGINIGDKRVEQ